MKVYKNNLVKIALKNQEQPELDEILPAPLLMCSTSPSRSRSKALKDFSVSQGRP